MAVLRSASLALLLASVSALPFRDGAGGAVGTIEDEQLPVDVRGGHHARPGRRVEGWGVERMRGERGRWWLRRVGG